MPKRDRDQPSHHKGYATRLVRNVVLLMVGATAITAAAPTRAGAQQVTADRSRRLPFTANLSNLTPLAFGMDVSETSRVLQQPLQYVSGRPGDEIYLALRNLGGSGLIAHHDRLFLKFRRGRLTGWKEDYGDNWMWR